MITVAGAGDLWAACSTSIDPTSGAPSQSGAIHRSYDGGARWIRLPLEIEAPYGVSRIEVIDDRYALAAGSADELYRTTDGGDTWAREHLPKGGYPQRAGCHA